MSRILTLNIGASKAVLAEYAVKGKSLSLSAYGSGELPAIDVNDPGSIAASLPSVLHQVMRESGIRPSAPLVVSLSGQMVFPRFAKFPPVGDAAKLDQLVRYEIEQNVPFPIDEIVSDCQFLGTTPEGERAAMIVAAKLEGVRAVTDAVRAAGLKPARVDVSPVAVVNALKFTCPNLDGCSVVLDIGSKTTNLIILEGEKIYNRSIPVAGNTITKDIAQAFGCSFEEAEQLKRERGYVALGGVTEDEDEVSDRVSKIVRTVLTRLHAEISRSINFYRSQQGGSAPTRLFLTGGSARIPQLAEFFMESLQVEVEFLNPFGRVSFGSKVDRNALENDAFALAESVGLALHAAGGAWISVNLMPPELVEEARAIRRIPFLAAGALAALAALGMAVVVQNRAKDVAELRRAEVEGANASLGALKAKLQAAQKDEAQEAARCDEIQRLLWSRGAALERVKAVRASLLPGMWIKSWERARPADEPAAADKAPAPDAAVVTIRGWRDAMDAARRGEKGSIDNVVVERLRRRDAIVADSVQVTAKNELKGGLTEFSVRMAFAGAPARPAADGKKKSGGKGPGGKAGE